jgi:hypothetical protein
MSNRLLCIIATLVGVSLGKAASPQLITAKADSAGAVLLNWASESNAVYRIEFATNLVDAQWQTLYEDYPSHGTNTIWKDGGNETGFIRVPTRTIKTSAFTASWSREQMLALSPRWESSRLLRTRRSATT